MTTNIGAVTIQPFREEISRIIATYLADGASRQLNLSSRERASLLHALANTTHPSAFCNVVHTVEWSLRHQAHPNFIRWTICNGNRPRVIFARGLGVSGIIGGIAAAILITLSNAGRGYRVLSAIGFMIGIATLIAAWKGMCVVSIFDMGHADTILIAFRCFTVCTTVISGHGSSLPRTRTALPSTWANFRLTRSPAPTATKTSHGSQSTRSVILSAKFSTVRSGFKSRHFARFRTQSSCRLLVVH